MKDQSSGDNWRLQEGERADDRWILQESEQRLADQWSLQNTPEELGQEWQPVEYVKARRPAMTWVLPTIITIALLAVIGYTVFTFLPGLFTEVQQPPAVVSPEKTPTAAGVAQEDTPVELTAVATEAPTVEPTPTEPGPPSPTPVPLVSQQFGVVNNTFGVNARTAPNTDAPVIRVLAFGETLFVFDVLDSTWVELFVNDTPLAEGQPLSGTIGYAAAEFLDLETREVSQQLVDEVNKYAGRFTPTPEPQPTAAPAPAEGVGEAVALPTVTPATGGAVVPGAALTETEAVTGTGAVTGSSAASLTVTINAVNGVNVRRDPAAVEGNVIRLLEFGTVVPAVARNEAGDWIQVLLPDGVTGWISAEYVQVNGDAADLPLPGAAGGAAPAAPEVESGAVITSGFAVPDPYSNIVPTNSPAIIVTVLEGVNARSAPDVDAALVVLVPQGVVLPATARSPDNQWVQVELPGGEAAWIFRDTVTETSAVGALPAVQAETPTPTPAPTAAPIVATPAPETAAPVATATVRQLMVNIYATPGSSGETVGRAPRGTGLDVTGRNTAGDWIQVVGDDGTLGWVAAGAVNVSVEIDTLPVVE